MRCVVLVEAEHAVRHRWKWFEHLADRLEDDWDDRHPGGCCHGIPEGVPATLDPRPLAIALTPILAGTPADGSTSPAAGGPAGSTGGATTAVVWVDGTDEIIAHLDSLTIKILDGAILASIDLEDETGRYPVVVRFAVDSAQSGGNAGLIAATDEVPGGHPPFAARWGDAVQNAAWAALLGLAQEHAGQTGHAPAGISAVAGAVRLHLETPVDLTK